MNSKDNTTGATVSRASRQVWRDAMVRQLHQWNFHGPLILELADSGEPPERIMERARAAREYLCEIIDRRAALS